MKKQVGISVIVPSHGDVLARLSHFEDHNKDVMAHAERSDQSMDLS